MAKQFLDATGLLHLWKKINNVFQKKLVSGSNIKTINGTSLLGSGNISISSYTLPAASATTRGGIKVGSGLSISSDVLSVNTSALSFLPLSGGTLNGNLILKEDYKITLPNTSTDPKFKDGTFIWKDQIGINYDNETRIMLNKYGGIYSFVDSPQYFFSTDGNTQEITALTTKELIEVLV